jgi:hypothetical protein
MNAFDFMRTHGTGEAGRVAEAAGSNLAYFKQIAYGHRRPSIDLAQRLVEASDRRLDLIELLTHKRVAAR